MSSGNNLEGITFCRAWLSPFGIELGKVSLTYLTGPKTRQIWQPNTDFHPNLCGNFFTEHVLRRFKSQTFWFSSPRGTRTRFPSLSSGVRYSTGLHRLVSATLRKPSDRLSTTPRGHFFCFRRADGPMVDHPAIIRSTTLNWPVVDLRSTEGFDDSRLAQNSPESDYLSRRPEIASETV
ncbi:hypothetical protein CROQUDRAFT_94968 [Cronartium quercuum f. sp. fusiforme G11]|uniref:Uncharacterized protein n=1 Tax=Cronartium quercuum f. sp. fusiforme G11 TaxID=708437 RepID=A0A9P6T9T3_9BASI|nr:hypothetical protein CROQUDRAFT_94968 [Cronartium quercuum f. sp. fusiforme G11]